MITFKVRNKDRLYDKFRKLAPAADEELTKANKQSADEMVSLARSLAPKDTGALRDSIVATPPGGTPPAYSQGLRQVPPGAYAVTAGNDQVRYSHLVEFGAAPHTAGGIFKGAQHPGAKRQPFFWPAYRIIQKKAKGRAGRALTKAAKKVAQK